MLLPLVEFGNSYHLWKSSLLDMGREMMVLNFMWLKFFLIWRYFRFWALVSGIEVPENMPRCINNCYNLESFWKSWHASFNKWLVRYMYILLGGSRRKLLNVWVVLPYGMILNGNFCHGLG